RTIGAADRDAFGTADRKRQRSEQAAIAMRHDNLVEGDQFAASWQAGLRQVDRKRRQDFDTGTGFHKRFGAISDQAVGDAAVTGATVLGPLLFGIEEYFRLAGFGTRGAAGLVPACLPFFRLLHRALGVAQRVGGAVEIGFG